MIAITLVKKSFLEWKKKKLMVMLPPTKSPKKTLSTRSKNNLGDNKWEINMAANYSQLIMLMKRTYMARLATVW